MMNRDLRLKQICSGLSAIFLFHTWVIAQIYQPGLQQFSIENGLSQSTVTDIAQDKQGFLWLGTQDGLNRFDGYQFRVYRDSDKTRSQLPHDYITRIVVTENGDLWIGTQHGLAVYNSELDKLTTFPLNLFNDKVNDLVIDGNDLWVGSASGLYVLSPNENEFIRVDVVDNEQEKGKVEIYQMIEDDRNHLWLATNQGVFCVNQDTYKVHELVSPTSVNWSNDVRCIAFFSGKIWLGTNKGLWSIHLPEEMPDTRAIVPGKFENYLTGSEKYRAKSGVLKIFKDHQNVIWIGTASDGLMRLDQDEDGILYHVDNLENEHDLFSMASIRCIFQDWDHNLWIGTLEEGIFRISHSSKKFGLLRASERGQGQLSNNRVRGLLEDGEYLWIGTAQGLNRLNRRTQSCIVLGHDPSNTISLSSSDVKYIAPGPDGYFWVSTNNGLNKLDPKTLEVLRFSASNPEDRIIFHNKVRGISMMDDGTLWVGTLGGGISIIDPINNKLLRWYHENDLYESGITDNNVLFILQSSTKEIWVTTYGGGLLKYDKSKKKFLKIPLSDNQSGKLLSSIHEDSEGQLWIGSYGDGVFRLDPKRMNVETYNTVNGLSSDVVYAAIPYDENIWMSTNRGLNRLNTITHDISVFLESDGLQSNEFNTGSFLEASTGELFFGGTDGLTFFHPDSIIEDTKASILAFTDLKIFNRSVVPGERIGSTSKPPIDTILKDSANVALHHEHSIVTFEFAALDFGNTSDIRYKYLLEGFDSNWIETTSENRSATYTNLPPGNYTFLVSATNGDGAWNQNPISLSLKVYPALWQTWWFRLSILAIALTFLGYMTYSRIKKADRRKLFLEKEIKIHTQEISNQKEMVEEKNERLKKLALRKDQLFFLLTHNMRSPLTSISGFLSLISPERRMIDYEDFEKHSVQMKHQVDDSLLLLDNTFYWSYSEFEEITLKMERVSFGVLFNEIHERFTAKAKHKDVYVHWRKREERDIVCDIKMTTLVLNNLMSNAVKFSDKGTSIHLSLLVESLNLIFIVENEGPEIPPELKEILFNDNQENISHGTGKERGFGIGLAISNKLVQAMGQDLSFESSGSKTHFILKIPMA